MPYQHIYRGLLGAIIAVALLMVFNGYQLTSLRSSVDEVLSQFQTETMNETYETSWTSAGVTHTVTTPKNQDESPTDWARRHAASVAALMDLFPPDVP